jgi:hypothetical protein
VNSLSALSALLRSQGGLIASLVVKDGERPQLVTEGVGPAQVAASGPRAKAAPEEYELLVETIYEGYLLHYEVPRVVQPPEADLGLLAGDQLYALGLAKLVGLGDVLAVAELADVITISALAQGAGDQEMARTVWMAGAHAVGWGPSEDYERAKALAVAGDPEAIVAMRTTSGY